MKSKNQDLDRAEPDEFGLELALYEGAQELICSACELRVGFDEDDMPVLDLSPRVIFS